MTTEAVHTRKRLIKVQPTSEVAWETFTQELAVALEALQEDEFLVLMVKQKNYFVQFAAQGSFGMRAEAVSNLYLPDDKQLSPEQSAGMLELGLERPDEPARRARARWHEGGRLTQLLHRCRSTRAFRCSRADGHERVARDIPGGAPGQSRLSGHEQDRGDDPLSSLGIRQRVE